MEVLSDTSESLTSDDEEDEGEEEGEIQRRPSPTPNKRGGNHLNKSGSKKELAGGGKGGEGGRERRRGKRGGRRKKKESVPLAKSATNLGQTAATQKKTKIKKASSEAVGLGAGNFSPPSNPQYPTNFTYGLGEGEVFDTQNVFFGVGGSNSSESSDEEEDLEYTPAEMAQLLSLNELDMQPGSSGSEEEEEEEEEEEVEVREKKRHRHRQRKESSGSTSAPSSAGHTTAPHRQSQTPAHARQPEPVGLFWDIENCSVPANKSAFAVAAKMRRVFFEGKREAEFMVVCDITKERKEVIDALNKAQVNLSSVEV